MTSFRVLLRALAQSCFTTFARAGTLALLLPVLDARAQPADQAIKKPPAWPTPEEYLANRNRTLERAASAPEPTPAPAVSSPMKSVAEGSAAEGSAAENPAAGESAAEESAAALPPFAVQLAAFRRYSAARAFAGEVPAEGVTILVSVRDGQQWHVVMLGLYATRAEAAAAEAVYRRRYPVATTWLRGTAGLRPPGAQGD